MAGNVYQQYVWLLTTISRYGGLKYSEISDRWQRSALNDTHERLPRRTFNNHLAKIREIFGIEIRSTTGYQYRIVESNGIDMSNLEESMLAHLQISNALLANPKLVGRLCLDGYLVFRYFTPLVEAMEQNRVVEIHYRGRGAQKSSYIKIEPYFVKQFEGGWFVVGREIRRGAICAYAFADIVAVRQSEGGEEFDAPDSLWLREFLRAPHFGDAAPNSNAQYLECHHQHSSRIRRGRWGTYAPEDYEEPNDSVR